MGAAGAQPGDAHASRWIDRMIHCIEVASFFNTSRMVAQYNRSVWRMAPVSYQEFS